MNLAQLRQSRLRAAMGRVFALSQRIAPKLSVPDRAGAIDLATRPTTLIRRGGQHTRVVNTHGGVTIGRKTRRKTSGSRPHRTTYTSTPSQSCVPPESLDSLGGLRGANPVHPECISSPDRAGEPSLSPREKSPARVGEKPTFDDNLKQTARELSIEFGDSSSLLQGMRA